jgi:hypothetical protein
MKPTLIRTPAVDQENPKPVDVDLVLRDALIRALEERQQHLLYRGVKHLAMLVGLLIVGVAIGIMWWGW